MNLPCSQIQILSESKLSLEDDEMGSCSKDNYDQLEGITDSFLTTLQFRTQNQQFRMRKSVKFEDRY